MSHLWIFMNSRHDVAKAQDMVHNFSPNILSNIEISKHIMINKIVEIDSLDQHLILMDILQVKKQNDYYSDLEEDEETDIINFTI